MKRISTIRGAFLCLILLFPFLVLAQAGSISGTVFDENNLPLPGASVTIKDIGKGTSTGPDGSYRLSGLSSGELTLAISFIGYQSLERKVTVDGNTVINFNLKPNPKALNEVVVIGYGTTTRRDVTGSVATVSEKDFQEGVISTPEQLITGKVAGVQITSNSGQPGAGSQIRIRGGASLNASNDPLIVIDGVPVSDPMKAGGGNDRGISGATNILSTINPNDIASITVLKDAASTAIYGSRASNGVILITTKKGSSGKPALTFNTQNSFSTLRNRLDLLSADEIRSFVGANGSPAFQGLLGTANTDWQDVIYQSGFSSDNSLGLSGTYKTMPYRFTVGYLNQTGLLVSDRLERTTGSINLSPKFFDKHLSVQLNLKGSITNSRFANTDAIGSAISFDPTQPVYAENEYGGYFEWLESNGNPKSFAPRNPLGQIEQRENKGEVQRSFGNVQLDYSFHFLPELHANLNLGYDISEGKGRDYVEPNALQAISSLGRNNPYLQENNNKVAEFYFSYNKDLMNLNSNINAVAGYGYYDNKSRNYFYGNYSANGELAPGASEPAFPFADQANRMISYYGRLIYTLNNKYIASASLRTDGSSRFNPDGRWGTFPGLALTWRMNEERFFKQFNSLSDLKLRLSYGVTGQQEGIANYSYLANYAISGPDALYQIGGQFYPMYAPTAYDENLKWETTDTYNAGLDYGFLNNRINGSVDVYYKKTKDLLATVPISVGTNFSNYLLTNVGNMENRGVEFSFNAVPVTNKELNWNVGVNFTYNRSKVTKIFLVDDPTFAGISTGGISGGTGTNVQIHSLGYAPSTFYLYKQVYSADGRPIEGVYEDVNGDGLVNESDLSFSEKAAPDAIIGFNSQFSYKKWSLSTIVRSNIGNYVYNNVSSNTATRNNLISTTTNVIGNATTEIFRSNFSNRQLLSDYYLENASFVRMDNLTLGYNAGRVFRNLNSTLRINATCQNVFVITKYSGLDPEISSGIDNNFYPRPRTFVLGFNLDF
ncbi:TonB-dependent receptor [Pedobacter sp. SYSU D00535]|uniref:SusC/RagA family TonB-linked outer membrane protein n=1 Tax=Pedobacter sp. SYSU D00535 TaxID=2810308 RepID=UPI001A9793BD|nr:TonB-dependent receptor [Pedobacter sp. SYSU D00535]